jgi:hypothetical protein
MIGPMVTVLHHGTDEVSELVGAQLENAKNQQQHRLNCITR